MSSVFCALKYARKTIVFLAVLVLCIASYGNATDTPAPPPLKGGVEYNESEPFAAERRRVEDLRESVQKLSPEAQSALADELREAQVTLEELIKVGEEYIAALKAVKEATNTPEDKRQRKAAEKAKTLATAAMQAQSKHRKALRALSAATGLTALAEYRESRSRKDASTGSPQSTSDGAPPPRTDARTKDSSTKESTKATAPKGEDGTGAAGLMALAADMDRVATDIQDGALAASDKFFQSAVQAVKKELEFLAQERSQKIFEPGKPLQQIIDYLKSDYNENDQQMYEGAVQAVEILQNDPARFWGEHLADAVPLGATALKLRIDSARKAAAAVSKTAKASKDFDEFITPAKGVTEPTAPTATPAAATADPKKPAAPPSVKTTADDDRFGSPGNKSQRGAGYEDFNPAFGLENCFPISLAQDLQWATGKTFAVPPVPAASSSDVIAILKAIYGKQAVDPLHGQAGHLAHRLGIPVPSSKRQIDDALRSARAPSRGLVFVRRAGANGTTTGHVFNARNVGSRILYWDAQVGLEANWDDVVAVFFYRTN